MWSSTLSLAMIALPITSAFPSFTVRHIERDLHTRQSTTQLPKMNITAWNDAAISACTTQLEKLDGVATNPAGMAVCYNLPFLDNSTGLFQADLRLYQISAPTGDFQGVPAQDVTVGLQYFGATVQPLNASEMAAQQTRRKRGEDSLDGYELGVGLKALSWPVTRDLEGNALQTRDIEALNQIWGRQASAPTQIQAYMFVGQVNQTLFAKVTTTQQLEGLLIPIVTLSALNIGKSGTVVNTTLSSDQATFLTGAFSNSLTPTQLAEVAAAASASALAIQSALPFKLPGVRILIFPVGALVTGAWALALVGTIAYGTVGRYRFQQQFRTRSARAAGVSGGKFYGGL